MEVGVVDGHVTRLIFVQDKDVYVPSQTRS